MLIYILTFLIPLLSSFGINNFISYSDPFLVIRDVYMDQTKRLKKSYHFLISALSLMIVYFIFKKDMIVMISLITSFISETVDFILTLKYASSTKKRMSITLACNLLDISIFSLLVYIFHAGIQLDFNMLYNFIFLSIIYVCIMLISSLHSTKIQKKLL